MGSQVITIHSHRVAASALLGEPTSELELTETRYMSAQYIEFKFYREQRLIIPFDHREHTTLQFDFERPFDTLPSATQLVPPGAESAYQACVYI